MGKQVEEERKQEVGIFVDWAVDQVVARDERLREYEERWAMEAEEVATKMMIESEKDMVAYVR